ncbi:hypothetical protein [Corynebacterium sp.]|uniref:hypothetical protein n=1 Tax=Corynebacterium sp. TaxID=1720 RepID=UPI0026DDC522|nr:hypothetical protein [Corynebacterium sp.]MDO5033088.1 hypothetical protein [Corynebacterium sp.]
MTFGSPGSTPQFGGGSQPGQGSGFGSPNNPAGPSAPRPGGAPTGPAHAPHQGSPAQGGREGFGAGFGAPSQGASPSGAPHAEGPGFGSAQPGGFGPAQDHRRTVEAPTAPTKGPWPLLIGAGIAAVVALVLLIIAPLAAEPTQGTYFGFAIGGWVLAGIVSFILLGLYTLKNTQRQAETFYIEDTTQTMLYRVIMGGSFLLVIAAAVEIAFYVGKAVGA